MSGYVLDTLKITDQWILTGGLRLDSYSLGYNQINANGTTTALSRDDLLLNYNAGITYKPLPFASFYAAYGTSSNPVGQELDGSGDSYGGISSGNALLDPERNSSIEIGTKWELMNRHLLATAALFQTDKENAREAQGQLVYSTGMYRIRGVELGMSGNLTSALSLYGGLVLMESEVKESLSAANIGRPFANIAHESFNLLAKYRINDWFTVGGQATYRGQIRGGSLAANNNTINEFWRFDALAEVKLSDHHTLQLQVLNVTDEVIYDALYRSGTPFVYVAPGRVGYATLQFRY
jgi:catecholate siderophore receptor